jgi:hypothetical protein
MRPLWISLLLLAGCSAAPPPTPPAYRLSTCWDLCIDYVVTPVGESSQGSFASPRH